MLHKRPRTNLSKPSPDELINGLADAPTDKLRLMLSVARDQMQRWPEGDPKRPLPERWVAAIEAEIGRR